LSSSGEIFAFNMASKMPDQFSRVQSWIGSFTAIQWQERPDVIAGGQDFPGMCCSAQGATSACGPRMAQNGQERIGSWPLDNIRMANERKLSGYDFHFNFGKGTHNPSQGEAEMPESMA
jgi:hypothetical protein